MLVWPFKDPDEILDYQVLWSRRLDGDTIATSVFFVDTGTVVVDSYSNTTTVATVWLSGGTLNESCIVTNRITTAGGRTMDQSTRIRIKGK
jgi:hypothetical protein